MSSNASASPWFVRARVRPDATLRLFCFPYAGGSSTAFRTWPDRLPVNVEVVAIEPPGRGRRFGEAVPKRVEHSVASIATAIKPLLDRPFVFFGHSLGAVMAYEVTRALHADGAALPLHLCVSGCEAPQVRQRHEPLHVMPEREFIEALRKMNGTPEEVLQNRELLELFTPMLRGDFEASETYVHTAREPLPCPITAFGGIKDPEVAEANLRAWAEQTRGPFAMHMIPGDHFFLHASESALFSRLLPTLTLR